MIITALSTHYCTGGSRTTDYWLLETVLLFVANIYQIGITHPINFLFPLPYLNWEIYVVRLLNQINQNSYGYSNFLEIIRHFIF